MTKYNYRTGLLCIVTTLYWFSLYTYAPTLSTYASSLGASYKMVGLIVGSYGLTQMLLRIPLGIVSDIINKRKIFIISGIAVSLVSSLGLWLFPSVGMVLAFRALSGVAAATWVTFTVLFSSYYEGEDAPKAIGIINSYNSAGQLIAILAGSIAAHFYGQHATFIVSSIGAVIGLSLSVGLAENRDINRKPMRPLDLLSVARDIKLLIVSVLAIFSQFLSFATVYGFTPIVAKNIGASSFEIGMLAMVSTFPRIIASYISGSFCAKRFGEKTTLVGGFIMTAAACVVIPYIGNLYFLYFSQLIGGFGQGLVLPMLMGLSIKNIQAEKRATAMGFFQAIYSLGMFLGPSLTGVLNDVMGLVWGFWFTGAVGIIGAVVANISMNENKNFSLKVFRS